MDKMDHLENIKAGYSECIAVYESRIDGWQRMVDSLPVNDDVAILYTQHIKTFKDKIIECRRQMNLEELLD